MKDNIHSESTHNYDVAKFIGNQHLADIRDIKNQQRNITFQYIVIVIAISGLLKLNYIDVCHFWIKAIIIVFAVFVSGSILQFQKSLSDFRKRIYNIWKQPYFKHAMNADFLSVDKKNPEKYTSFWYQFYYPIIYISLILFVMSMLLLIL